MKFHFKRGYKGLINIIEEKLKEINIISVIKNESESERLAEFTPPVFDKYKFLFIKMNLKSFYFDT